MERAKDSNDPDRIFNQLIKETKKSPEEVEIYTDGTKTKAADCEEGVDLVGCAILVPHINKSFSFKLNSLTSSFMAEVFAIVKALQLVDSYSWPLVNICSDSLSVVEALKNAEYSLISKGTNKLNVVLAELSYKIYRANYNENRIRFTWCPAHVGIALNESVDLLAKGASYNGKYWNNDIIYKEIASSLKPFYENMNSKLLVKGMEADY